MHDDTTTESDMAWLRNDAFSIYSTAARSFVIAKGYLATYKAMVESMRIINAQFGDFPEVTVNDIKKLEKVVKSAQDELENAAEYLLAKADKMMQLGLPVDESLIAEAAEIATNA